MAQFWRIRIIGINFGWIYTNLDGFILIHTRFNMFIFVFHVFMNLVCPISVPQAFFLSGEKTFLDFWTMPILEIVRIDGTLVYTVFGTC